MSMPSLLQSAGNLIPASELKLLYKSRALTTVVSSVFPEGISPFVSHIIKGICIPPSNNEALHPLILPARLPLKLGAGPLSLVKMTMVLFSRFIFLISRSKRPICLSYSASTTRKFFSDSCPSGKTCCCSKFPTHGVCMSSGHKFTKQASPL